MNLRALFLAPVFAASLVACGSGGGGSSATIPANATVITAIEGIAWDAKTYTAQSSGGKVLLALRNNSSLPHDLHLLNAENVDQGVALQTKGKGDTHTLSYTLSPGTYTVICTIAGHGNMKATLTVT